MLAIQKNNSIVSLQNLAKPTIKNDNDVLVRIIISGLCRTDLYVAKGLIKSSKEKLVLGHEFSGVVEAIGDSVTKIKVGDRVSVMPTIPCGDCRECESGFYESCPNTLMLGQDLDGAFAEFIVVNQHAVFKLLDGISFQMGAYIEPLAASCSVLRAGILPHQRGLIYGDNRIAQLTHLILLEYGFSNTIIFTGDINELQKNEYDFVIETVASSEIVSGLMKILKPKGIFVIKSRIYSPVAFPFIDIVRKEIVLKGTNYMPFDETIKFVASIKNKSRIESLWNEPSLLKDFQAVFDKNESKKQFFNISE